MGGLSGKSVHSQCSKGSTVFPYDAEPNLIAKTRKRDNDQFIFIFILRLLSGALLSIFSGDVLAMLLHEHAQLHGRRLEGLHEETARGSSSPRDGTPPSTRAATPRPRRSPAARTSPTANQRRWDACPEGPATAR